MDTPFEVASDARIDVQSGIGVLYNPSLADVQFAANVGSPLRNREVNRSLIFGVNINSESPPIRLIVSHWPAHGQEEFADTRLALGGDLRTNITNWSDLHGDQAFAIMCGDFNDDPFDKSISAALFSTRDRELARNQPVLSIIHSGDFLESGSRLKWQRLKPGQAHAAGYLELTANGIPLINSCLPQVFSAEEPGS